MSISSPEAAATIAASIVTKSPVPFGFTCHTRALDREGISRRSAAARARQQVEGVLTARFYTARVDRENALDPPPPDPRP
jgi:hypothetical protein